jgi:bifunctional UDP-N-acetylglucosamine pyrophosphorylase/glucosamine-1-phosphate N-acetyltransferase
MLQDVAVVILAAGQGTRMKSRLAKVLHRAGGRTLLEHAIAAARRVASPERIFVVVGHQAEAVGEVALQTGVRIIHQKEQLGTGHAVLSGAGQLAQLGGRLVIFYGDCPMIRPETLEQVVTLHRESKAAGAMATIEVPDPTGYGRIIRGANGDVTAIVEHKAASPAQREIREINPGVYSFDAGLFWKHVGKIRPDNPAREYYLTDMIEILIRAGKRITAFQVPDYMELVGINNRVELAEADTVLRARKARELMLGGITIEQPDTVSIDADVRVGQDTIVGPFVQLRGATTVGENCRIEACCILDNTVVADNVEVYAFSCISDSTLESRVHVGPYARMRMGAYLEEDARVGNFVELKKTRIGRGAKSMHLAYLGDSTIGAKANIGAGTITCNYDGKKKHQTEIGAGAFVGSNSTLIAPLEIGDGAYIAAGSVITLKVPNDTLALGRARQVNKPGWKQRLIPE